MNNSSDRDVEIFTEAVELAATERAAYLERACGGDTALRQRVEALLQTHAHVGDFLENFTPPEVIEARTEASAGEKPGDRIGRYKLLEQIGEGGYGVVFLAEQEKPVHRRVALKVIKPGMDTKSVIARFEAERQVLALLDHPNIAKIFDAGATESSRPYFVMELIRGRKITEYCDQHDLTVEERMCLFVQVCQTIQHAHQKGVIHRDIKPSNILVTTSPEGDPIPVVIDFGIAKATTNHPLTDKTLVTTFAMLVATPAYMSPEQAALNSGDLDTRTDIYSLGVLLYELLTGSTPFDTNELMKTGLDEVRRVIRERDPIRPSTRLSKMPRTDQLTVAKNRRSEPAKLIRVFAADLDAIVMKCLEKDRTRRYETANGLALDVKRFLANEPISARPPSKLYQFQKLVVRNKLLFVSLGVIALLLVLSLIFISDALAKELRARREADAALEQAKADKSKAEMEAIKSRQVTKFLEDMLQGVGPSVALGRDTTMLRDILDRTAEQVGGEMTNQPAVEAELRGLIGRVYLEIGSYKQAEQMERAALTVNRKQFGPKSKEVATSLNDLGLALWKQGKLEGPETCYQEALAIRRQILGNDHPDVAASLANLSDVYRHQGKIAEAEAATREALRIRQKNFGNESLKAADSIRSLSMLSGDKGDWSGAETLARKVLAIRRQLLGPEHPLVASALEDVAWAVGANGKVAESESLNLEALAMRRKLLGEDHPDVARSLYLVAGGMRQQGKLNDAYSVLNAALSIQTKLLGESNPATLDTLHSLGLVLAAEGKLVEAEKVHRQALTLWREGGYGETSQGVSELESLVRVLMAQKKFGDAEQLLDEALTPAFVSQPASKNLLDLRFNLKARLGEWQQAAADAALAYEHQPLNRDRYAILAALYVKSHNRPAYEQFCRGMLAKFATTTNTFTADQVAKACLFLPESGLDIKVIDHLATMGVTLGSGDEGAMPFFAICKALSEYRQRHFAEAAMWAQKTLKSSRTDAFAHAYAVLALADWQLGKKDEAQTMLANGETLAPGIMPRYVAEDSGNAWVVWLFARITLNEATALIRPGSPTEEKSDNP